MDIRNLSGIAGKESGNLSYPMSQNQNLPTISSYMRTVAFGFGVTMLLVCFFGFLGNVLTVVIFSTKRMRSPINTILTGLCVIDMVLLAVTAPLFAFQPIYSKYNDKWILATMTYSIVYLYPVGMAARTCSVWLFVLITFERYLAVCYPLKVNRISSNVTHARYATVCVVAVSAAYNFVRFWEFRLLDSTKNNKTLPQRALRKDPDYQLYYHTILYLITHFLAPFLLLIFFNIYIIRCIHRMRRQRKQLSRQQIQEHRTTYMMITLIIIFVSTNTLPYALNIVEAVDRSLFNSDSPWCKTLLVMLDTSNLLVLLNSSTNFIIYLVFSKRYRMHFVAYIQCRKLTSAPLSLGLRLISKNAYSIVGFGSLRKHFLKGQYTEARTGRSTIFHSKSQSQFPNDRRKISSALCFHANRQKPSVQFYNNNNYQASPMTYYSSSVILDKTEVARSTTVSDSDEGFDDSDVIQYGITLLNNNDQGSYV